MPKIRDYANAENLEERLTKEGLNHLPHRVDTSEADGRVKPVFRLTIGNPEHDAIVTRLAKEGFAWEVAEVPSTESLVKNPETDPPTLADDEKILAELDALSTPAETDEDNLAEMIADGPRRLNAVADAAMSAPAETDNGGGAGNQHGQDPGPAPADVLAGMTFETGDYVRVTVDYTTGKVISAEKVEPPAPVEEELPEADTEALAGWLGDRDPKSLPRLANAGLSDLFFNYGVDGGFNPEAVADRAKEFSGMVLNAFGVAVDPEELVSDYFARL